jgi:hypothetical protein
VGNVGSRIAIRSNICRPERQFISINNHLWIASASIQWSTLVRQSLTCAVHDRQSNRFCMSSIIKLNALLYLQSGSGRVTRLSCPGSSSMIWPLVLEPLIITSGKLLNATKTNVKREKQSLLNAGYVLYGLPTRLPTKNNRNGSHMGTEMSKSLWTRSDTLNTRKDSLTTASMSNRGKR